MRDLEGNEIEITEKKHQRKCSVAYCDFRYFCYFCSFLPYAVIQPVNAGIIWTVFDRQPADAGEIFERCSCTRLFAKNAGCQNDSPV